MFQSHFKKAYLNSLEHSTRFFYDDFCEYGSYEHAKNALYFIPGINGTPGQIRFTFPSLMREFGQDTYIKCLYLPEFSATQPVWEKYTIENVEKKRQQIIKDITALLKRFDTLRVFCSSNGFYDFIAALSDIPKKDQKRLRLYWAAAAPDRFHPNTWFNRFYKLNGFIHNNHRWAAFPNHNMLKWLNTETGLTHVFKHQGTSLKLYKHQLESRFKTCGTYWAYASIECFNDCLTYLLKKAKAPIDIPTRILVASADGYWNGFTTTEIEKTLQRYIKNPTFIFKPTSHLWVVRPDYLDDLVNDAT
jgi:pimeloyl-ACP methyl ester carboxylesterase